MSAPPLPEAFGNYALGDFVEVASPAAISWLPQTIGWWWLGAAVLAALAYHSWRRLRSWYRNRYRREAERRLQRLANEYAGQKLVIEVNKLLKLTAMAAYSRAAVASLSGEIWVEFLQGRCATPTFSPEQGRTLAMGSYRAQQMDPGAGAALIAASIAWVRAHQGQQSD